MGTSMAPRVGVELNEIKKVKCKAQLMMHMKCIKYSLLSMNRKTFLGLLMTDKDDITRTKFFAVKGIKIGASD